MYFPLGIVSVTPESTTIVNASVVKLEGMDLIPYYLYYIAKANKIRKLFPNAIKE